jgi:hypothetical protein
MNDITKATPRTGLGNFVGKRMTKSVKFMGEDVNITKMSVHEVQEIQAVAAAMQAVAKEHEEAGTVNPDAESSDFGVLKLILRLGVEGAKDLTDAEIEDLPIDELSRLSNEVMKYVGLGAEAASKGK